MMIISEYGKSLLRSTCCHSLTLRKGERLYIGIYNGLSCWGRVEDGEGNLVEELSTEWEEPDPDYPQDQGYLPNFSRYDFNDNGYTIVSN